LSRSLPVPSVMIFAGHMVDLPGRPAPRFPDAAAEGVKTRIRAHVSRLGDIVAFASAACGSDILFLEAILENGGRAHVVLPYDQHRFVADSVDIIPGGNWKARFDAVLARASSVTTVSMQKLPLGGVSYVHANKVLVGMALLQSDRFVTTVAPLAVWDGKRGDDEGGTASMVDLWKDLGLQPAVLALDSAPSGTASREVRHAAIKADESFQAAIKVFLFADVKEFSRLDEASIPGFVTHLLGQVGDLVRSSPYRPVAVNTWGDGFWMVFDSVTDAGCFALVLRDRIARTDWSALGLPQLGLRIALHVGPAFRCTDPVTGRSTFLGSHVNRAARMEPQTPVNEVYASQEFAAVAAVEKTRRFTCEYVGSIALAKEQSRHPLYRVRYRTTMSDVPG